MKQKVSNRFWSYAGRFSLVYVVTYTIIAIVFLNIQNALPSSGRVALDFFEPYSLNIRGTMAQALIGVVIALVLYPFYDLIVKKERNWLILFAALWGVALLGSLEPKPGSIEGMLYTETTFAEHLLVLAAGAVQALLFCQLFLAWERRSAGAVGSGGSGGKVAGSAASSSAVAGSAGSSAVAGSAGSAAAAGAPRHKKVAGRELRRYAGRFTLLHVIIYLVAGIVFYQVSGYQEALATMEAFKLWRPLENMVMPFVILFGQVIRGGILALLLYPFYGTYMQKRHGWLLLLGLLFGLKVLVIAISVPATLAEFVQGLQNSLTGLPEIIVQTLLFSLFFFLWERRRMKNKDGKTLLSSERSYA